MKLKSEWESLLIILAVFLGICYVPVGNVRFDHSITESLALVKWYAREHVIMCLVPAFFIAGAISVFISQAAVMKYLESKANRVLAYGVASISGSVLAVCSCTVLPLFAGIYKQGAGLGPATAFLYSGPAINEKNQVNPVIMRIMVQTIWEEEKGTNLEKNSDSRHGLPEM